MASAADLLDFFSVEKDGVNPTPTPDSGPSFPPLRHSIDRRRSFNGIHGAISRINPPLLKSLMASGAKGAAPAMSSFVPCARRGALPSMPVYIPVLRSSGGSGGGLESSGETAPLTIFYNGTVAVFNVPPRKAEDILKLAISGSGSGTETARAIPSGKRRELLGTLTGDLPIARRISLQRFLEKRKERLSSSASPYSCNEK